MSQPPATEGTAASQDSPPLPGLTLSPPSPALPLALAPASPKEEDPSQRTVDGDPGRTRGQGSYSNPALDKTDEKSRKNEAESDNPRGKVSSEAGSVDTTPTPRQGDPKGKDTVATPPHSSTKDTPKQLETQDPSAKSLPEDSSKRTEQEKVAPPERSPPEEDEDEMGNRLGGEKSKGKKGERKDGRKEERREEKRRRQGKTGDKKKSKCPADPDSLTTEIEDESSSFGFHSFENLLAGALGGSRSPKHRGGTSQASARDEDERDEVEWVPMSIEDEGGVQFKPDADDSSTASQGYSTPLLATPLMKRSQQQQEPAAPPRSTAERLDQLGRAIQDTIFSNLPDVRLPQERDSIALLGRADSLDGGSTDTLTLDDPTASRERGQARPAAGAAAAGDTDGRTSSSSARIPGHVALDSRTNGSGSSTPVLRRRRDGGGSATSSPVLRRHNEGSSPSTPVLRRRNEGGGSATSSPVLRQRGNQGSAPGTPVLKQRSEAAAQAPRSPTLSPRHQAAGAGSPPPVPPHQGSSPSSPVLRQRSGGSGPDSPSLRHRNREPGSNSPVLPPRRQDSPSSPVPRRRNETSATGSPILRLKSQNSTPGSPVLRAKVQGSGANSPVLLRRQQEGSAPGSPTLRRNAGSASNSPVLRPRHQVMGPSALALSSGTQTPSTDSGLSTPASESRPVLQGSKGAGGAAPQSQVSSPSSPLPPGLAAEPPPPSPPPRTYPSNRPLPFPLDVDKLTDLPLKGAPAPSGLSHSLTRPATGPKEPMPPPECFHASLPRDSSRDSGLSLARAAPPPGDEEWMDEMFYSCQDVSFEKELRDDVVDGEQFLQPTPGPPHLAPPPSATGNSLVVTSPASQARARGEKPKVVSQYDNVQDAEDAVTAAPVIFPAAAAPTAAAPVPSVSPTSPAAGSSSSSKMKSARGSKPAAGPFGIKEQKPSQTATTTTPITSQQGLQQPSSSGKQAPASAAATSLGGGGGGGAQERSHPTVLRQDGATVSVEPPLQAVAMETASRAPPATAATTAREQPSQKEVTEHNLQLLVQAIEKLPHFDMAATADVRDSLSMDDDSLAEAEESSPTDSSFEEARLRRVELKCVEVTCAAEKKKTPPQPPPQPPPQEPAKQPQVSTVDLNVAQGGGKESRKTTPAISARVKTSEKQVSRKEADTVAGKSEAGTGSPDTFVPPPSPSAMAELAEVEEEDEEDEEALERQEAAIQQQRALEARLFGDTVVKRLSSLLDSMGPVEESEPSPAPPPATAEPISSGDVPSSTPGHTTTTTSGSLPGPSSGGPNGTAAAAAVREVTLATISLGEVAGGGNPRPTTLPTAVAPGPGSASAAKCRAREAVVCSVASVQASRVQSEVVLESSPCVSPTSKPKSAGSVADGERSQGAEAGAFYITGTERQKSGEKTQDATKQQEAISSSHAQTAEREQVQAAAVRDVQGCDSVADSKVNPHDEGEKENKKQDTGNQQQPDSSTQAGVVKKPSIPDLLVTTAAEEAALAAEEAAEKLSAEHSHQEHVHPHSSTGTLVLFQIGESTHPDSGTTDKTSGEKAGEKVPKTQGGGGGEVEKREEATRPAEESEEEGEATSPTTPVAPKRESQQIHDVISAYWGADETPTDTDSRTLSRSSLGESSELTGDSRSDTLSAESKGDRLSVCTADTDSSFDDHVFTGMVFENRTYQGLQSRPPGDGGGPPSHPRSPAPGPPSSEAAAASAIPSIVFENSARKERERPVKIPSLIFGNSSLRTEGALPGNHCRESSGNSSSDVEADVEADEEDEEEEEEDDEDEEDADSQEDNPSRHSSKRPSTSSVESASALRVPALEETFGELQGVKTFLEELQDRTPTAERLPVFVGPELHRAGSGGLGAAVGGGAEASPSSSSSALWCRRSRMSPAVTERTESDLDASEHRDDISSTGESMYADDEDEGQDFFADDPGSEVMVGCGASYYSAPEGGDGDGDNFWAECSSTTVEDTYQELETSMDAASTVFRNARRQMHDIHEHLQDLRRQMEMLQDDVQHARIKVSSDMDSSDFQPALE